MCFRGDEGGPDIWLTVENGRYVPAPPMVYVPGLRQIQDRLHHKARSIRPPLTSGNDKVRAYMSPTMTNTCPCGSIGNPTASAVKSSATSPTQPLTGDSNPRSASLTASSTASGQDTNATTPTSGSKESTEAPKSPEAPSQERSEEAPGASQEVRQEEQSKQAVSLNGDAPDSLGISGSSISNNPTSSPFTSPSSSLRSILKKPLTSASEGTVSDGDAAAVARDNQKYETEQKKARRPKIKKYVAFAEDLAPPASPQEAKAESQMTAAEEGAAIARKLVERESALQSGGSKRVGRGDGSADLGYSICRSKHGDDLVHPGGRMGKHGKQTERLGDRTKASGRGSVWKDGAAHERAARAKLARYLLSDDETDSNVDDDIPWKWP